jgi:hypothetical protein
VSKLIRKLPASDIEEPRAGTETESSWPMVMPPSGARDKLVVTTGLFLTVEKIQPSHIALCLFLDP